MEKTIIRLQNALKNETVEKMFRIDLMNIFKELGINYPKECEILSNNILLDLKETKDLTSFEKITRETFENYKVLGKDLLKVISEKKECYNEALFFEIRESIKQEFKEIFTYDKYGFVCKGGVFYEKDLDCVFAVDVLSHSNDLNALLKETTSLTKNRIVIIETVPFYTRIKETEINKDRTFLNDYFYHRIFFGDKIESFVGNYKTSHALDVLIAQHGFEIKIALSKNFDFNHSLLSEEKRPIVKTKHYIGVYEKASDSIIAPCK